MNQKRTVVNTTVDSSQFYMQVIPTCPYCESKSTALKVSMDSIWEEIGSDVFPDRTITKYKSGYRCGNCLHEDTHEVTLTTYVSDGISDFEKLVENMRKWQKEYFKHRTDQALQESKKLEKKVDQYLKDKNEPPLFNYDGTI